MKPLLYLSGPISSDPRYRERFKAIEQRLKAMGYSVVNPAELAGVLPVDDLTWDQIMQFCIDLLTRCDYIVQLSGWERSLGCQREYGYAIGMGIPAIPAQEFFVD